MLSLTSRLLCLSVHRIGKRGRRFARGLLRRLLALLLGVTLLPSCLFCWRLTGLSVALLLGLRLCDRPIEFVQGLCQLFRSLLRRGRLALGCGRCLSVLRACSSQQFGQLSCCFADLLGRLGDALVRFGTLLGVVR